MTRLPARLQPLWPLVKRLHRLASWWSGLVGRHTRWLQGDRALPARGTVSMDQTRALEPEHVTIHRVGDGEAIRHPDAVGEPPAHWVFRRRAVHDVPPLASLEIAGGTVVGDYGANLTPGGTLDYETSEYFGIRGWREHPLFLRRRLPEVEHVEGTVVSLATRGGSSNYYHFLTDVLPRFGVFEATMPGRTVDALYVPATAAYQRTLLDLAGLGDHQVIATGKHRAVRADHLVVPCLTNPSEVAPRWTVDWLRSRLTPTRDDAPRTRLYVTRGQVPNTRRLEHEDEIVAGLAERGFVTVEPGGLTPQEQIDTFSAAEVVVAPHGAALTNLLFVQPGTRVLEMFAADYVNACYWSICQAIPGVEYRYLVAEGAERHGPGDPMNKIQADIDIPPATVLRAVDDLLT